MISGLLVTLSSAEEIVVENNAGVGARSMGMGGTGIASAEGVSALIYNPAALTRIKSLETEFGLDLFRHGTKTSIRSSQGNGKADDSVDYSGLGSIGIAYPVPTDQGSLVFAAGYHRVKDFNESIYQTGYNDNLAGTETVEILEEGGIGIFSFGGAVDVSPTVSVGATLDIWYGEYTRNGRSLLNDYDVSYSQLDFKTVDDEINAVSFKPSILYYREGFRFGAFVRLPMTFNIKESYRFEGYSRDDGEHFNLYEYLDSDSEFSDDEVLDSYHLDYEITTPMQLGAGFAWGTARKSLVTLDLIYENWTQAKLKYPSSFIPDPRYFKDKYKSSIQIMLGAEKHLNILNMTGRIGYMRQPVLFEGPNGYDPLDPRVKVKDMKDFVTLGVGKVLDNSLIVDVGYAHGFWKTEESPKTFETSRDRVYVNVTYRMPTDF